MKRILTAIAAGAALLAVARELPLPQVPAELRTPAERADYVARHFYDGMDWADSAATHDRAFAEQNFSNFASIFPHVSTDALRDAAGQLLRKAAVDTDAAMMMADVVEQYLFDRESPVRNLEAYELFLEEQLAAGYADSIRAGFMLDMVRKNKPGTMAADFAFTGRDGAEHRLSDSFGGKPVLLMFYDPSCSDCALAVSRIAASPRADSLTVVAVYSGDDTALWSASQKIPAAWTDGIDGGNVDATELYFLPQMPTLYLIDPSGRIILKDATVEEIIN